MVVFTNGSGGPGFPGGPVGPGGGKMLRYLICLGFTTGGPPSGNGSTGIGGSTNGSNRLLTTPNHTPLIVTTLYNLCKICNISKKECTCKKEPFLCSLITAKPGGGNGTNETELRCITTINNVKAAVNTITGVIGVIGNALVVAVTLKYLRTFISMPFTDWFISSNGSYIFHCPIYPDTSVILDMQMGIWFSYVQNV